jgi:hypothetical protein
MHRTLILASLAAAAFAPLFAPALTQDPADLFNRAPADVDQALRARITEFFHYHVTGEHRKAEALVAEDTQDYFYNNNKPRYVSFEIGRIEYSDGYTKATALITVKMAVLFPGFNGKVMDIPTASYWKLVDGKWYWYLTKAMQNASPMGEMHPGPPSAGRGAPVIPNIPANTEELFAQVKVDKEKITVQPGSQDQIVISNGMVGPISLTVQGKIEGIQAALDRAEIKSGEKATMTVKATEGAAAGVLTVHVQQTGQNIPIQVVLK